MPNLTPYDLKQPDRERIAARDWRSDLQDHPAWQTFMEMTGIPASQRITKQVYDLFSMMLRPETPLEWVDYGSDILNNTAQMGLAAADIGAAVPYAARGATAAGRQIAKTYGDEITSHILDQQPDVIQTGFRNLSRAPIIPGATREATFTPVDRLPLLRDHVLHSTKKGEIPPAAQKIFGAQADYIPAGQRQGARKLPLDDEQGALVKYQTSVAKLKGHADYGAAKNSADYPAAQRLVADTVSAKNLAALPDFAPGTIYQPIHAIESGGKNQIPSAMANFYAKKLNGRPGTNIVQTNVTGHSGSEIMDRLLKRPEFDGQVVPGAQYVIMDDVVTSGGTLIDAANYIENQGGRVVGTISLANAARRANMAPDPKVIKSIQEKFGDEIKNQFGIHPNALTAQEADYINRFKTVDALRDRVSAARSTVEHSARDAFADPGAVQWWAEQYADNPAHREISAAYHADEIDLATAQQLHHQHRNTDSAQKSVFDHSFEAERSARLKNRDKPQYTELDARVEQGMPSQNMKTAGEIVDLDTSRGCLGMCQDCYASTGTNPRCFLEPVAVRLKGDFNLKPGKMYRVGTNGDPNLDPRLFNNVRDRYHDLLDSGDYTVEQLDEIIEQAYDWRWTNQQLQNSNLASPGKFEGQKFIPGGRDQTYVITKLQSLKNFDPAIVRHVQVSLDPMMPTQFFKSLENAQQLIDQYPAVNVQLRIRSTATYSDELNSLQKIAVDFANKNQAPVLETRLRFKKPGTLARNQALPEYYFEGGQYKHVSYYPSNQPKRVKDPIYPAGKIPGGTSVKTYEIHAPDGNHPTSVYIQAPLEQAGKKMKSAGMNPKKNKAPVWEVWADGQRVAQGLPIKDAHPRAMELAQKEIDAAGPSKGVVRQYAVEESPLSQFGLDPQLHKQCNTFNAGAGACGICKGCRAFLEEGKLRSVENNFK